MSCFVHLEDDNTCCANIGSKARSAVDNEVTEGRFAAENVVIFDIIKVPIGF
jgi:hypothetical protein